MNDGAEGSSPPDPASPERLAAYYDVSEKLGDAVVDEFRLNGAHRRKMESRSLWMGGLLMFLLMVTVILIMRAVVVLAERLVLGWAIVATIVPGGVLMFGLWFVVSDAVERVRRKVERKLRG